MRENDDLPWIVLIPIEHKMDSKQKKILYLQKEIANWKMPILRLQHPPPKKKMLGVTAIVIILTITVCWILNGR